MKTNLKIRWSDHVKKFARPNSPEGAKLIKIINGIDNKAFNVENAYNFNGGFGVLLYQTIDIINVGCLDPIRNYTKCDKKDNLLAQIQGKVSLEKDIKVKDLWNKVGREIANRNIPLASSMRRNPRQNPRQNTM